MIDIVVPNNNEKELVAKARELGIKEVIFLYDKVVKNDFKKAYLAKNSQDISKNKGKHNHVYAKGEQWAFQDKRIDLIFGCEALSKKDFMHHRGSEMNQVLAKQLRDHKTIYSFNFNNVLKAKEKDLIIGRMMQNAELCKKYKVKIIMASFATKPSELRTPKDLRAFCKVLGITSKDVFLEN